MKLQIRIPDDVVRIESQIFLEVKLTNVTNSTVTVGSTSPTLSVAGTELRDAHGSLVARTSESIARYGAIGQYTSPVALAAGASRTARFVLNEMFDLRKPGEYTIRTSGIYSCGTRVGTATSNKIHFNVGRGRKPASREPTGISITVNAPRSRLPVGWIVPIEIAVKNNSRHPLRWFSAATGVESGVRVFRPGRIALQQLEQADSDMDFVSSMVELPPGERAEAIVFITGFPDVSKPGKYAASVALLDPSSRRIVTSNIVKFEVADPASEPRQPPFVVTLQPEPYISPRPGTFMVCIRNISNHPIRLDNSIRKDFYSLENLDLRGTRIQQPVRSDWNPEQVKQISVGIEECCTWYSVKPRSALCGGSSVDKVYDLSTPGSYRVRVDRYDENCAKPGQKLGELPVVRSNWLTILLPGSAK